ncbi:gamma-glutamyltransferase [Novosphingobium sp. Rr 2-17]|uniref:gamma-glutamyltransferase n=1 Tax=Novosphingobium sp. Rr 2-17 TaxID=555793 RepID=UPI0002699527|nr:gamma-glutamyltransferase [Novosphingobium sp. Rr 2-17]EIZ79190.1 gamma-glutamyltransferase [Novosphingobium sp. Rr 2-17]
MTNQNWALADAFSSRNRPVLRGEIGAVSAAHPLAVAAGQSALFQGGSAVDAAIAAQAVLCVVAPDACGLGGDMFALVGDGRETLAITGAGAAPLGMSQVADDGPRAITLPGIAGGWDAMHQRWGRLSLAHVLAPAIRLARDGITLTPALAKAVATQRARLERHGAGEWSLLNLAAGDRFVQPALAALLSTLAEQGALAFYGDVIAQAIVSRVQARGGALSMTDFTAHETPVTPALTIPFQGGEVAVQPPPTQGVLLAMALAGLEQWLKTNPDGGNAASFQHVGVELTEAAFAHRDDAACGAALLDQVLTIDPERAALRGGPRAYLHTAGVSTADAQGLTVSSLISVFDDFGSCVFVPELGLTLNNRAGGFTSGANAAAPGKRPVHTLAPAMLRRGTDLLALATPGADGQVQTLLQVIGRILVQGDDLASTIAAPRWRSEGGQLLIEDNHPALADFALRGHRTLPLQPGDMRFGSVACAGVLAGQPIAVADWRRENWAGVA